MLRVSAVRLFVGVFAMLSIANVQAGSWTNNKPPVISGTPNSAATVGVTYSFTPSASDPEGRRLSFSIANKPSWASFSRYTGTLSGTPTTSGSFVNIVISVSDGKASTSLAPFSIAVSAPLVVNHAPQISGTPAATDVTGVAYNFQPTASDADGNALGFSIQNKPVWATFNTATGALSGTPTSVQAGTYANITISVSDGLATTSLPAFAITVSAPAPAPAPTLGSATLSWTPPTTNTDGSVLTDLTGYQIYYGTDPSLLTSSVALGNPGLTNYVVANLTPATYYFAIKAVNSAGVASDLSQLATKTVN